MCLIYSESLDVLPFCRINYLWVKRMLYAIQHDDTKRCTIKTEMRAVSRRYRHDKAITVLLFLSIFCFLYALVHA